MAHRIYGKAQEAQHRTHNVACEVCGKSDTLTIVQANDTRSWARQGKNRVKIDCASIFDTDNAIRWGSTLETETRAIAYLAQRGITLEWHNKRVCSKCYDKFAIAANNRYQ